MVCASDDDQTETMSLTALSPRRCLCRCPCRQNLPINRVFLSCGLVMKAARMVEGRHNPGHETSPDTPFLLRVFAKKAGHVVYGLAAGLLCRACLA